MSQSCSCLLGPGQSSSDGWHLAVYTEVDVLNRMIRREAQRDNNLARLLRAQGRNQMTEQDQADLEAYYSGIKKDWSGLIKASANKPWAFEMCPAYQRKANS